MQSDRLGRFDVSWTDSRITVLAIVAALAAACGREAPKTAQDQSRRAVATSPGGARATYAPASPTCAPALGATSPESAPTHASGYLVCGPFTASAGGGTFECRATGSGPYRLIVRNGSSDGVGRTSSATVRVDGALVLGPSAFDKQVGAASVRVALAATSWIEVGVADGGALRVEIVDESQRCSILAPADVLAAGAQASVSTSNPFAVPELQVWNGGVDGGARANKGEVRLDGVTLVSGLDLREKVSAVVAPVTLRSPSALVARAGEKGLFSLEIVDRDATPPGFRVEAPAESSVTRSAQVTVSGFIDDASAAVLVNGALALVAGGEFSQQVQLQPCWNTITVEARDACGNASAATIRVGLDPNPPAVAVVTPASGAVSRQGAQPVVIRFSDDFAGVDASSVKVTLDGADVTSGLARPDRPWRSTAASSNFASAG